MSELDPADRIAALERQLASARAAALILTDRINDLGSAVDDNDPRVMATAGPIGAAEADLWVALGIDPKLHPSQREAIAVPDEVTPTPKHCDNYIDDFTCNDAARWFLFIERLPATTRILAHQNGVNPRLFADHDGKRVRVVMASCLGDVGITERLDSDTGYAKRVFVEQLSNFGTQP
jgi:hypothetical protein